MPTIETCGHINKRKSFSYTGTSQSDVTLHFDSGDSVIPKTVFHAVLAHFQGQTVKGGFSMDNPPDGGVGAFVAQLGSGLTPRHASFICAILQHEGLATTELKGSAVHVSFPAMT